MPNEPPFVGPEPVDPSASVSRPAIAADAARELITFADGVEDAGHPDLARRSRHVARELLWLVDQLDAERSARRAIQAARDRLLEQRTG